MKKSKNSLSGDLFKSFSVVGLWTLASRLLGFLRDILMANFLGASAAAEAFIIAFSLPNMFRRLFAEGAFNTAFIPMFSQKLSKKSDAVKFASESLILLSILLLLTTAIAEIFMPALVFIMASGFSDDSRLDLAVGFGRVMFPYIILISISAFFGGILNSFNKFGAVAAAPLLLNIFLILALLLAYLYDLDIGWSITFAVPLAGLAQLLFIWIMVRQENFKFKFKVPTLNDETKKLVRVAIPAAMAGGVIQINLLVGRQVASYFEGAIAWLNYSDRLYQLPLGVVGITLGVVLLPRLSTMTAIEERQNAINTINRSSEFALLLALPAAAALCVLANPIVSVLFERGLFTALDSANTSKALVIYSLGLPAFVLQKIFSTIYFANGDTKSPFRFSLVSMFCNLVLAVGLAGVFGFLAAPIATTLSGWLLTILLFRKLGVFGFAFDTYFRNKISRILIASIGLAITTSTMATFLATELAFGFIRYITLFLIVSTGAICYFLICYVLGVFPRRK